MMTAEDSFWDSFIMTHPKADNYRRQTQPDYDALCRIFHDNTADVKYNGGIIDVDVGHKKFTPTDAAEPAFVSQRMSVGKDAELDDAHDSSQSSDELQWTNTRRKCQCECEMQSTLLKRRRWQGTSDDPLTRAFEEMASAMKLIAERQDYNSGLPEKCIHALKDSPDLDRTIYLKSFELFKDVKKARTFLAMQPADRKDWPLLKFGQ